MSDAEPYPMRPPKGKSVLKTLRISEETAGALDAAAKEDGLSLNSLASSILTDYVEWGRKAKKFGFAQISRQMFKLLLEASDPDLLSKKAAEKYGAVVRDMASFWYQDTSPQSMIRFYDELSQHSWYLDCKTTSVGRRYTMTFHHDLGSTFTKLLRGSIEGLVRDNFHTQATFEVGEDTLTAHFSIP